MENRKTKKQIIKELGFNNRKNHGKYNGKRNKMETKAPWVAQESALVKMLIDTFTDW